MTPSAIRYEPFDEVGEFIDRPGVDEILASIPPDASPTDVFLFSHGWNNNFADASATYGRMLEQMTQVADATPGVRPEPFRPLALGVIWPAKSWDESAAETEGAGEVHALPPDLTEVVYENLSPRRATAAGFRHDVMRMLQLITKDRLSEAEAAEFRGLLRQHADRPTVAEDESIFEPEAPQESLEGIASGDFSARDVFRIFTYWQMKKRAGAVGQSGVRALLAVLQSRLPAARFHLIGHSFGCKVVLSAVAGLGEPPPAPVQTVVLLQAAVSFEALAETVTGTESPGGYRVALDPTRVDGPIVATYSQLDDACSQAYPLASRLGGHVGELEGLFDRFQALGAIGAAGLGDELGFNEAMREVGDPYHFGSRGVWSVDGGTPPAAFITGHSDIATPQVAWLLWSAVRRI